MADNFYIYAHKDCYGLIRYIGKGSNNRAWNFLQRSKKWNECFSEDKRPDVIILKRDLSEWDAFNLEAHYISAALEAGMPLINIAAGGPSGWDDRAKSLLSQMRSGINSPWFGKKRDKATFEKGKQTKRERGSHTRYWAGKKRDPELIKKLVAASHTPEAIAKSKAARALGDYGWTEARKEHLSKIMTGRDLGPEHGKKISEAKKGKPNGLLGRKISEETKAKMSAAAMGRVYRKEVTEKARATKLARGNTTSKAKQIRCIETGVVFRCAKDVSIKLFAGKGEKVIQQCCVGSKQSYRRFHFEYL